MASNGIRRTYRRHVQCRAPRGGRVAGHAFGGEACGRQRLVRILLAEHARQEVHEMMRYILHTIKGRNCLHVQHARLAQVAYRLSDHSSNTQIRATTRLQACAASCAQVLLRKSLHLPCRTCAAKHAFRASCLGFHANRRSLQTPRWCAPRWKPRGSTNRSDFVTFRRC
jgi:hypothetical protein